MDWNELNKDLSKKSRKYKEEQPNKENMESVKPPLNNQLNIITDNHRNDFLAIDKFSVDTLLDQYRNKNLQKSRYYIIFKKYYIYNIGYLSEEESNNFLLLLQYIQSIIFENKIKSIINYELLIIRMYLIAKMHFLTEDMNDDYKNEFIIYDRMDSVEQKLLEILICCFFTIRVEKSFFKGLLTGFKKIYKKRMEDANDDDNYENYILPSLDELIHQISKRDFYKKIRINLRYKLDRLEKCYLDSKTDMIEFKYFSTELLFNFILWHIHTLDEHFFYYDIFKHAAKYFNSGNQIVKNVIIDLIRLTIYPKKRQVFEKICIILKRVLCLSEITNITIHDLAIKTKYFNEELNFNDILNKESLINEKIDILMRGEILIGFMNYNFEDMPIWIYKLNK